MFYCYSQNNSGGSYDIDDDVAHYVIIEASSAAAANERAKSIGIYFDGCNTGYDCPCCGDRWDSVWADDEGEEIPSIYGRPISESRGMFTPEGKPYAHVYYVDGHQETFRK